MARINKQVQISKKKKKSANVLAIVENFPHTPLSYSKTSKITFFFFLKIAANPCCVSIIVLLHHGKKIGVATQTL